MLDWQERVVAEKKELDEKINKLDSFLLKTPWTLEIPLAIDLLYQQIKSMRWYSSILKQRIMLFTEDANGN